MQEVLAPIQRVRFTKSTLRHASIRDKKGPSLGETDVKVPHQRSPYETERQQRCARCMAWNLANHIFKHKEKDKAAFPRRNGYSRLRQQESRRKESL